MVHLVSPEEHFILLHSCKTDRSDLVLTAPGPNDDDILDRYHASSRKASFLQNLNDGQLIHLHQNAREEYAYECARGVEEVEIKLRVSCHSPFILPHTDRFGR